MDGKGKRHQHPGNSMVSLTARLPVSGKAQCWVLAQQPGWSLVGGGSELRGGPVMAANTLPHQIVLCFCTKTKQCWRNRVISAPGTVQLSVAASQRSQSGANNNSIPSGRRWPERAMPFPPCHSADSPEDVAEEDNAPQFAEPSHVSGVTLLPSASLHSLVPLSALFVNSWDCCV